MAAILRDSTVVVAVVVVVVVRTRPRAIPLAMITMRKSTHGFPFVFHIWVAYGAPLGGPSGRRSYAIMGPTPILEMERACGLPPRLWLLDKCNICSRYCIYHVKFTSYCKLIECSRPIRFFIASLMYNNTS